MAIAVAGVFVDFTGLGGAGRAAAITGADARAFGTCVEAAIDALGIWVVASLGGGGEGAATIALGLIGWGMMAVGAAMRGLAGTKLAPVLGKEEGASRSFGDAILGRSGLAIGLGVAADWPAFSERRPDIARSP